MAEREREDKDGTSLFDGAVIALDDMMGVTAALMSMLEKDVLEK